MITRREVYGWSVSMLEATLGSLYVKHNGPPYVFSTFFLPDGREENHIIFELWDEGLQYLASSFKKKIFCIFVGDIKGIKLYALYVEPEEQVMDQFLAALAAGNFGDHMFLDYPPQYKMRDSLFPE